MKFQELDQKSEAELQKMLVTLREKVRDLRFQVAARQHKDVRDIAETKKTIAQILTLLNQRKTNQ